MKKAWVVMAMILGAPLAHAQTQAQPVPLTADALAQCARQVQQLRSESPQLLARVNQYERQREAFLQRSGGLKTEAERLHPDNLQAGLDLRERRSRLNAEITTFNQTIANVRQEIVALNGTKDAYDQECSRRPYRRSDFERLPAAAQAAMKAGMADIAVPFIGEALQID